MIKTLHVVIKSYTREDYDKLYACNRISAMIWNKIVELAKFYRIVTRGK